MNISHTSNNEQHLEDEFTYQATIAYSKSSQDDNKGELDKSLVQKLLTTLDDTTPNYVLGYN